MTSRYCYCPMTAKRIGRRVTIASRIRRAVRRWLEPKPDVFQVTGYYAPYIPRK